MDEATVTKDDVHVRMRRDVVGGVMTVNGELIGFRGGIAVLLVEAQGKVTALRVEGTVLTSQVDKIGPASGGIAFQDTTGEVHAIAYHRKSTCVFRSTIDVWLR